MRVEVVYVPLDKAGRDKIVNEAVKKIRSSCKLILLDPIGYMEEVDVVVREDGPGGE